MNRYLKTLSTISFCALTLSTSQAQLGPYSEVFNYPFYHKSLSSEKEGENKMMILNSGIASLQLRLQMIQRAKKTIELEYFIFQNDASGKLIVTELIKKAQEGVKVRLLLDKSITVIRFDEYYAEALMKYGVEVSYYNRALDPSTAQFRNHRKMISIDGQEAITGGRNIGLDYFDLDPDYNFHDRDVWVEGPIVKAMVDSFDAFWNSSRTKMAKSPDIGEFSRLHRSTDRRNTARLQVHHRRLKEAQEFVLDSRENQLLKKKVADVANPILAKKEKHVCPETVLISDKPGATFLRRLSSSYKKDDRILNQVLKDKVLNARESFFMESPYFLLNDSFGEMLQEVLDRGLEVTAYTNSLNSTDAVYVATGFYSNIFPWIKRGLKTYVHSSKWQGQNAQTQSVIDESIKETRYGVHSKTFIIDDIDFTIGTYNVDNRSDFYNTEMTLFCKGSPELVRILKDDIAWRLENAYQLHADKTATDSEGNPADMYGGASESYIRLMKSIKLPVSWLEFLL